MHIAVPSFPEHPSPNYSTKNPIMPDYSYRSSASSRRQSVASPVSILPSNKSSKSIRDRRRSSGTLSTHSVSQKARKTIGDYYVGKTLGKGASGRVKLGIHRQTGEQVAIKIISKAHLAANPAIEKAVRREIAIMKLIRHPNVMSLVDVIDDAALPDLHLILEYVEGGELFEYLVSKGRLGEPEARHHFQQIILGLDFCHHHLICHRDLKPENLLLDAQNNIKIADFGMASLQPAGSMLETSCGSPHYASPEIVAGMPYNGSASDIWSCGVILYALLTGHLPFDDENIRQLLKKVKSGKYTMPDDISRNAQDLIRRILVVDPTKRLTMEQIMAHPWFRESELMNLSALPVPPTENEIGRPVNSPSDIDDRLLETIKFLWGETDDEVVIEALVSKEHNMQKVVYVLLQQHAERYWQTDHDEDSYCDYNAEDDRYHFGRPDPSQRRYRTIGHHPDRDRRCLSMVDNGKGDNGVRPVAPWMPDPEPKSVARRYSAATMRADTRRSEFMPPPPLPPIPATPKGATMDDSDPLLKKSDTFYTRFVKGVLSSRRHSKDKSSGSESGSNTSSGGTLSGTLRRRNPFAKVPQSDIIPTENTTEPVLPPKSTLRPTSNALQRNKIEPVQPNTVGRSSNTKRLSIRVPNLFSGNEEKSEGRKFGVFTINSLGSNRRQRKQLDLSVFGPTDTASSEDPVLSPQAPQAEEYSTSSSSASASATATVTATATSNNNEILETMRRIMNGTVEVRSYEKKDKAGIVRYKAEMKTKGQDGKLRQVKCRIDFTPTPDGLQSNVQFTQQQGDALLLASTVRQLQDYVEKEQGV
ncbi:kinase-like domain-containing protein [Phycomyces blakesleeanus]